MLLHGKLDFGQLAHILHMLDSDMILLEHDTLQCITSGVYNAQAMEDAIVLILPSAQSLLDLTSMFLEGSPKIATVLNHRVMEDGVIHAATLSLLGETVFTRFTIPQEAVLLQQNSLGTLKGSAVDFPAWPFVQRILNLIFGNGSTVGRLPRSAG